jgi:uncharacterized membrane protein YgdD (TMEM256/DUF423 family)
MFVWTWGPNFTGVGVAGAITPIGGLLLIAGWLTLAVQAA